ncbi:MFS transporter [Streptomyces avicenniae]|uniref:MFS transporter n=1 Tax=Streptomyces avicenniae TaxID=500153 RepID=UPI00069C7E40|nr:MFS transporter [Streptomyces avicenniae]
MRPIPLVSRVLARPPLAGSYAAAVALVLLALCPFLVLTTATSLMAPALLHDLHATPFELQLAVGLSNAGYAFGAVAAADLIQRVPRRHVYFVCEAGFVLAAVVALSAQGIAQFSTALILLGLFTGLLLVVALPPLITRQNLDELPTTAAVVSVGLFGMVTLGPLVGGLIGDTGNWRLLFTVIALLAAAGLVIGFLSFAHNPPLSPGAGFDWLAIPPALAVTALPFFGVSWLTRSTFGSLVFLLPVIVGVAIGVVLVAGQYRAKNPLMPVKPISNTLPVAGIAGAMLAGAAFTTLIELSESFLLEGPRYTPVKVGSLLTPQLLGVLIGALIFRRVLFTRWTPLLALSGLLSIGVAALVLLTLTESNASVIVPVAALFLGYGAGAGVTPGLFLAGLSVPAVAIGSIFALVELLRSEAAFLIGPVLLHFAEDKGIADSGYHVTVAIVLAITVGGALLLVGLYAISGARPRRPDMRAWMGGKSAAYHSPPLAARFRKS